MNQQKTVNIDKIDPNLAVKKETEEGFDFYPACRKPFDLYGLLPPEGTEPYRRIPKEVAEACNEGVVALYANAAGGRVRFQTDASVVKIRAKLSGLGKMPHFALTGSVGFDLYADGLYAGSFVPPFGIVDEYVSSVDLNASHALGDTFLPRAEEGSHNRPAFHDILIHFPLYTNVVSLEIGLPSGSTVLPGKPYRIPDPVVYYGSSITQGGCASRPGNSYEALLSRWLDIDHINLGFSGSGRGEDAIAQYMAKIKMAAMVMDYDHNAPTAAHLNATHFPMYLAIRNAQPQVPILMVTRPKPRLKQEEVERFSVILASYEKAKAMGDDRVYFVDGTKLFSDSASMNEYPDGLLDDATVDGSHPTDLGFYLMARNLLPVLKKALLL